MKRIVNVGYSDRVTMLLHTAHTIPRADWNKWGGDGL